MNKANESCRISKKIKRNAISITKKLSKRKESNNTPAKKNGPISQTYSESLQLTIQTYWIGNKELKMKLGQLQQQTSKASLLDSGDSGNDFKSIILETYQRKIFPFMRIFLEE